MDTDWLKDFAALVELGNFSRAAEARNLTQPAFSRRIRALEDWVGAGLFDRTAHPVALTEAGRRFRPAAEEILRRLGHVRDEARRAAEEEAGALTFAATHVLSLTFFPRWLRAFERRSQLGAVRLSSDSMRACERLMTEGGAQFLLCHHHDAAASKLEEGPFRSVRVGGDSLTPAAAPSCAVRLGDVGAPFLAYHPDSGMGRIVAAKRADAGLKTVFSSHLATVLQALARDGRGIAWLPRSLIADDLASGALIVAGDAAWEIPLDIRLIRPKARQSPAAEAFWSLATSDEEPAARP